MRHRFGCVTAFLVAIVLSLASAPARADSPHASPPAAIAHVSERAPAVLPVGSLASVESVHVYLIAQLSVPDAVGRDTAALHSVIDRARTTVVSALEAERIPVYRGALILRDSNDDPASPTLHRPIEPPNRERMTRASRMSSDSAVLTLGLARRR